MVQVEVEQRSPISIHAPPRGATLIPIWETQVDKFQFTPLCEGRRYVAGDFLPVQYFNSRPSARGDEKNLRDLRQEEISIHAPPRGATAVNSPVIVPSRFQFTPLREGRPDMGLDVSNGLNFNSRPSARGDAKPRRSIGIYFYFNSRPSARGD